MHGLSNYFRLIRALNCALAAAGVLVGGYFTWVVPEFIGPLLTSLAAFFVCAAGNIINDVVDINVDRINHPKRMLVTGEIEKISAARLAFILGAASLILGLLVNLPVLLTIAAALTLVTIYNLKAKQIPLVGNFIVAILGGVTFIAGGLAVDTVLTFTLPGPLIPAIFAFLFHLAREIVKDVEDIEGDRLHGVKTLPQIVGVSRALLTSLGIFFIFSIISFVPVFRGWFGRSYELIAVYLIDLPLLLLLILVWGNPTPKMLKAGSVALKGGMVLGILALLLAR